MDPQKRQKLLFQRLHVAKNDLGLAVSYSAYLIKKGWHANQWERRGSVYMQQSALTTALVVAYCRPFTKGRGWPEFPQKLVSYDTEERRLHEKLLELRNQVYAHSDSGRYEIRPVKLLTFSTVIVSEPQMKLTKVEAQLVIQMATKVMEAIDKRLDQLMDIVADEDD